VQRICRHPIKHTIIMTTNNKPTRHQSLTGCAKRPSTRNRTVKCCAAIESTPKTRATVLTNLPSAIRATEIINQLDTLHKKQMRKGLQSELFVSTTWPANDKGVVSTEIACYYTNDAEGLKELDWVQDEAEKLTRS